VCVEQSCRKLILITLVVVTCFFFIWSANPVHGVLTLVVAGLALAGLLLKEALEFPALLIVLVYVGAVTVLFIFVVMMVNLRATPVSYLTAESYMVWGLLSFTLLGEHWSSNLVIPVTQVTPHLEAHLNLSSLGFVLYGTERVYAVFLVGLVLFVAMIAAICLSLVGGENYRTQEFYSQIRRSNAVFTLSTKSV
jgi:NADH-quinone oxidoreductase subunit J